MLFPPSTSDQHVQRRLVVSLYARPGSQLIGSVCSLAAAWAGALTTQNGAMELTATMLTIVAAWRIGVAWALPRVGTQDTPLLENLYGLGAFSYSGLCGVLASQAIINPIAPGVRLMMVGNTIAYGVGVAARNAGRPTIAIGQTMLAFTPVILACVLHPDLSYRWLGLSLLLAVPAIMLITRDIFNVLHESIAAADTSADLADSMQKLACTDAVTGLRNRNGLNHEMAHRLAMLSPDRKLALLWLDLARFKDVNETLGYQAGDRVLAEVGSRLTACAPPGACIARFGGDEFIIACETTNRNDTEMLARGLLDVVTRPFRLDGDRLEIASSIGIAIMPEDGTDLGTAMQSADIALAHCKVNGSEKLSFYSPEMTRNLIRRKEIEADLRLALQRDELSVYFQPVVHLATGHIRGFEALVRWFHPTKGEMRPDEFIPVAEECGAIITLGNWITTYAARCAASWPVNLNLAVNLSPLQIKAPGGALGIRNALRQARLDPARVILEVTETVLLENSTATEDFMAELVGIGIKFALDDFGTGYSSLSYLNKYPFSRIKVDRSFVSGAGAGLKSDAIVRSVSSMAAALGMEVVAEGVETASQVESVRLAGCTSAQGYYYSEAVPDHAVIEMMLKQQQADSVGQLRA